MKKLSKLFKNHKLVMAIVGALWLAMIPLLFCSTTPVITDDTTVACFQLEKVVELDQIDATLYTFKVSANSDLKPEHYKAILDYCDNRLQEIYGND